MKSVNVPRLRLLTAFLAAALLLLPLPPSVYAQGRVSGAPAKPKIAVYATGGKTVDENMVIGTKILAALVNDGRYLPVERMEAFIAELSREQRTQMSGAVDEREITRLGKHFGVQFVCIANITEVFGTNLVSARIVNVETAEVVAMGTAGSLLKGEQDLSTATERVTSAMFSSPAAERGAEKIAVYVTGVKSASESQAFGTEILYELVKDGMYRAVERSNAFVAEIAREQAKQRSGTIDDSQILALGKQFGTRFVCIADVRRALGTTLVSARVINVETAVVVAIGVTEPDDISNLDNLSGAAAAIVNEIYRQVKGRPRQSELVAQQRRAERDERERQEAIAREERERRDEEERRRAREAMERAEAEQRQELQREEEERARQAEKERRVFEAARQKEWDAREKREKKERRGEERIKRGGGLGGGVAYQPTIDGVEWHVGGGDITMIVDNIAAHVFLDFGRIYATVGVSTGSGRWEEDSTATIPYDAPLPSSVSADLGLFVKMPLTLPALTAKAAAGGGESVYYPFIGVEYQHPVSAKIDEGDGGFDAASLSVVWLRMGFGADFVAKNGAFLRLEWMLGIRGPNKYEKSGVSIGASEDMTIRSAFLGVGFKLAVGNRI